MNKTSLSLTVGQTNTLIASFQPDGATGSITWSSNKTSVATVNSSGMVTAIGEGTATITAKYSETIKATCTVTVTPSGGQGGQTGDYIKVASYDFSTGNTLDTEYTDASSLKSRFSSSASSSNDLSDIVTNLSNVSKVYAGYKTNTANYLNFGIKFGSSSNNGVFTLSLSQQVVRVVVNAAGWGSTDSLTIGDASAQTPGVAYNGSNPIKTLTFDITASNSITFTFAKRGFIQSIDFYMYQV